jgi:hypothetical protein
MRHTVRPFKIELKSRSSRSKPMCPPKVGDADRAVSAPSFLDTSHFLAARGNHASGYDAAMKAAEAVFDRGASIARVCEAPPSTAPMGRVLPSLIENSDALAVRIADADVKARRNVARQAETSPIRRKKTNTPSESAVAAESVERVATETSPAAAPDRERRSIRKRRLLDAELKIGEKWKRRLCTAAR